MSEEEEKKSLLIQLIKLAEVDAAMKQAEYDFLIIIAQQLGVSEDEFNKLFDTYIDFKPPAFEFDRILQFQRLVLLMNVDLDIDRTELQYIRDLGMRLGLRPLATEEILKSMHEYPNKVVPAQRLIEIFKTFHN